MKHVSAIGGPLFTWMKPYQREGTQGIEEWNGRALLADSPGLGKTIQVVAWMSLHLEVRPVIIICPAVAKHHWRNTLRRWLPNERIVTVYGRTPYELRNGTVYIINWDIISNNSIEVWGSFSLLAYPSIAPIEFKMNPRKPKPKIFDIPRTGWVDYLCDLLPELVVLDESQKANNKTAARTRATGVLCRVVRDKHLICTSGTPADSRPKELYNSINWVNPQLFPSQWDFKRRYCNPKNNGFGWTFDGASNSAELHEILIKNVMIRRTKKDVMSQLPPKTRGIVPLEISNRAGYAQADNDFMGWLRATGQGSAGAQQAQGFLKLEMLKQAALKGKMAQVLLWIEDFLESGEKLVVFAIHKSATATIMAKFGGVAVKIDGDTPVAERERAEHLFQTDDKIRLFVGNVDAAGVSLTLTAATSVAMIELPMTPGKLEQCEDRVYGRINDPHGANIYFLVAMGTKEEDIAQMLDMKAQMLSHVLDGKDVEEGSMLTELMKKWKGQLK